MTPEQLAVKNAKIAAYQQLPPAVKKFYQKLNKIQPGLGAKWLANVHTNLLKSLDAEYLQLAAVGYHFIWADTPQGNDFWYNIERMGLREKIGTTNYEN